ncbi:hypothetical protein DFP72DRAFT_1073300 [Ephemerocybe angulata]|uniref:Uncharacterized protein n=1 Tax=Ephemerocybe angulata TaxID=980116 RepID=A0A8H6HLZ1_9AGAR|nr:hypothetical protein DFP72DRAFT_1073300 [Tulosesus angulatus]
MRLSFFATVLPIALSLASLTAARGHDSGLFKFICFAAQSSNEARDYVDELATREILFELTTRELIDELSDRLERRAGGKTKNGPPKTVFVCKFCMQPWETLKPPGTRSEQDQ